MAKVGPSGASGGGQLAVPVNAYVREDGVITAPPPAGGTLLAANNLSDVLSASGSRTSLGLAYDALAADIQPPGPVPAAGSNGKVPDSGHVHPLADVFYSNMGSVLAWNYPPSQISTSSATGGTPGTNATVYFLQMPLAYAETITSLNFGVVTAATGTITHAYAGLVSPAGLVVALSADRAADTALVTSASLWSPPLSSPYPAAAGTWYANLWILMAGGGTPPAFARCSASGGVPALLNIGTAAGAYRFSQLASQTAIVTAGNSYTPASNAISSFSAWCALT